MQLLILFSICRDERDEMEAEMVVYWNGQNIILRRSLILPLYNLCSPKRSFSYLYVLQIALAASDQSRRKRRIIISKILARDSCRASRKDTLGLGAFNKFLYLRTSILVDVHSCL